MIVIAAIAIASVPRIDLTSDVKQIVAKAEAGKSNVVSGREGWLFFTPELRHLTVGKFWGTDAAKVSRAPAASADPLPAILDFKAQVEKVGAKLLLVPVPAKATIYPEMLVEGAKAPFSGADAEFLAVLKSKGLNVIDLTEPFLQAKSQAAVFSRQDTHWSGAGISIAANLIAAALSLPASKKFPARPTEIEVNGDLATLDGEAKAPKEKLTIFKADAPETDRKSPLLLVGDSHCLIYSAGGDMLAEHGGLPEALAIRTGIVPDVVAVRGSGATPARVSLARRGDNLKGKKFVVWVFTVREFTEGQGWRKVPVVRPDN